MARPLYPADTGGRIRSSKLLERLSRTHHVTILCFRTADDRPEDLERMRACCARLETIDWAEIPKFTARFYATLARALVSPLPFTVLKYRSRAMTRRLSELTASGAYDLLVCDFLQPSVNCLAVPFRPKVLFQHNVEAVIRTRHAAHATGPARLYLQQEAAKLKRFEGRAAAAFDHCIMVSEEDCRTMQVEYGATNTSAIPTGVDIEYFDTGGAEGDEPSLVFVGSMDWLPNQDAVDYFTAAILPRVRREVPARFVVVGRNPPESIRRIEATGGITVTGTVDDVRPFLANGHVCVVPIRIGGGTRIKIFEAMAMGKAVVSTTVGAEGLPVTHESDILLADTPDEFAAQIVRLLESRDLRQRIGQAGRDLVSKRFTWDAAANRFSQICTDVVHQSRMRRT
jgi:polysaccharide biosynthesis protein PslH